MVHDLAVHRDGLLAVTSHDGNGALWRSADGTEWRKMQAFEGAEPIDLAVYGGAVYVGTVGPEGTGSLWGPAPPAPVGPPSSPRTFAKPNLVMDPGAPGSVAAIDAVLADPDAYENHGAAILAQLRPLTLRRVPAVGDALTRRMAGPFPDIHVDLFGGQIQVPGAQLARWYMLWAIAYSGGGYVPSELLLEPWRARRNNAEKYLEPVPAAAWAISTLGQNDEATLGALITRLGRSGDPDWLEGDIVGALTALSGERFGYDREAWRAWWAGRRH